MVSQIPEPERKVVSPAAYLLFYRRRSATPLGPQYLRDLVTSARNASDNDASTAASSDDELAGEDSLGGPQRSSRLLGSSSNGVKAGAAVVGQGQVHGPAQAVGNHHLKAARDGAGSDATASDPNPSARPRTSTSYSDEDEGISMTPAAEPYAANGGWSFDHLSQAAAQVQTEAEGNGSDTARSDIANLDSDADEALPVDTDDEEKRHGSPVGDLFDDTDDASGWEPADE